jgi:hypothetical protein
MDDVRSGRPDWTGVAVITAAIVIAWHGLVHLMGAAVLWKLGQPGQAVAGLVVDGLVLVLVAVSWLGSRRVTS